LNNTRYSYYNNRETKKLFLRRTGKTSWMCKLQGSTEVKESSRAIKENKLKCLLKPPSNPPNSLLSGGGGISATTILSHE